MPTAYTNLLGFALPVEGELAGTWGNVVNNSITELVEDAIAATATQSVAGGDWTLTTTGSGSANQARCAILVPTGSPGVTRNIIAPSLSKAYIVDNQTNAAVVIKGAATTGATVASGARALVAWTGTDFVVVATSAADGVTSVSGTGTVNGITLTGAVTSTGSLTLGGALSGVSLSSQVSGTLPVANGGTGGSDAATARNNLSVPSATGAGASGTWGINISGNAATVTNGVYTSSSYADPAWITSLSGGKISGSISGSAASVSGVVAVANGGTGLTSTPANGQIDIGNGTGFTRTTLTAGSGVSIVNGAGSITISATGGGGSVTSVTASSPLNSSGGSAPNISLTGVVPVANGGTGGADAATARSNLGVPSTSGSGASGLWAINITGNAATATSATTAASASSATAAGTLATANFTVAQSGSDLLIQYNGTPILKISSGGVLTALGDITSNGTV